MNAAVAESEQRWQSKEQELQTQISELEDELRKEQLRVSLLHATSQPPPRILETVFVNKKQVVAGSLHTITAEFIAHCFLTRWNY